MPLALRHPMQFAVSPLAAPRAFRVGLVAAFTLASLGVPLGFGPRGPASCSSRPGEACRCSLAKRLSGTCCCSREAESPAPDDDPFAPIVLACCAGAEEASGPVAAHAAPAAPTAEQATCCSASHGDRASERAVDGGSARGASAASRRSSSSRPEVASCPCSVDPAFALWNLPPRALATRVCLVIVDRPAPVAETPEPTVLSPSHRPLVPPPELAS